MSWIYVGREGRWRCGRRCAGVCKMVRKLQVSPLATRWRQKTLLEAVDPNQRSCRRLRTRGNAYVHHQLGLNWAARFNCAHGIVYVSLPLTY
jgi:hypothetical protein